MQARCSSEVITNTNSQDNERLSLSLHDLSLVLRFKGDHCNNMTGCDSSQHHLLNCSETIFPGDKTFEHETPENFYHVLMNYILTGGSQTASLIPAGVRGAV